VIKHFINVGDFLSIKNLSPDESHYRCQKVEKILDEIKQQGIIEESHNFP